MKKRVFILTLALFLSGAALSVAHAQSIQNLNNPNSSYPPSNQPGAPPNEPDHTFGRASGTHMLPDGTSPDDSGTGNSAVTGFPDSGGSGNH